MNDSNAPPPPDGGGGRSAVPTAQEIAANQDIVAGADRNRRWVGFAALAVSALNLVGIAVYTWKALFEIFPATLLQLTHASAVASLPWVLATRSLGIGSFLWFTMALFVHGTELLIPLQVKIKLAQPPTSAKDDDKAKALGDLLLKVMPKAGP